MIRKILGFLFVLMAAMAHAEETAAAPQMADRLREDGKIYVVISVISIVFLAIVLFLVYLERRISRLEAEVKDLK